MDRLSPGTRFLLQQQQLAQGGQFGAACSTEKSCSKQQQQLSSSWAQVKAKMQGAVMSAPKTQTKDAKRGGESVSGGAPAPLHLHLSDESSSDYYERYKTSLTASYPLPSRETPEPKYHGIVETYREIFEDLDPTTQDGGGGGGGGRDSLETSPSSLQQRPDGVRTRPAVLHVLSLPPPNSLSFGGGGRGRNGGKESTTPRDDPPSNNGVLWRLNDELVYKTLPKDDASRAPVEGGTGAGGEGVVVREGVQVLDDLKKNSPPLRKEKESVASWVLAKIRSKIRLGSITRQLDRDL